MGTSTEQLTASPPPYPKPLPAPPSILHNRPSNRIEGRMGIQDTSHGLTLYRESQRARLGSFNALDYDDAARRRPVRHRAAPCVSSHALRCCAVYCRRIVYVHCELYMSLSFAIFHQHARSRPTRLRYTAIALANILKSWQVASEIYLYKIKRIIN